MNKHTFAKGALFIIYFWFGMLKVLGFSPASPLIGALLKETMPFFPPAQFFILFGLFEMLIGILFLFSRTQKIAKILFVIHMVCVFLPLVLLPQMIWTGYFVPTLEGQYIIKNLALIAAVLFL